MKASKAINADLNKVLRHHIGAINQFFLHARMLKNWGFAGLGKFEHKESIEIMKEADVLIERILFLEGLPNVQDIGKLLIGEDVPEILQGDLTSAEAARETLIAVIANCEAAEDFISRDLLTEQLEECEERIDFYETQRDLLTKIGLENYLQSAIGAIDD